jgi:S-DNA-T family DNA segregation ATPase FtsK/SpoIIIE
VGEEEAKDDDIEFEDLATAPDPLSDAIDLDAEDDEDVDEIIERLVADDDDDDSEDEDESEGEDDDDDLPPSNGPQSSGRPAGNPAGNRGVGTPGNPGLPVRPPGGGNPGPANNNPGTPPSLGSAPPRASIPAAAVPGTRPPVSAPTGVPSPRPGDGAPAAPKPPIPGTPASGLPGASAVAGAPAHTPAAPPKIESASTKEKPEWKMPLVEDMLTAIPSKPMTDEELRRRAEVIEQTLSSFGAPGRVVEVNQGPVITQFGVEPDYIDGRAGKRIKVKVGKISALADDLALSLAAPSIRIEAPVPGKGFVGIEVPNAEPSVVNLRSVMDTPEFQKLSGPIKLALGQDVSGQPVLADLSAMPHLLIAGTTGSGKSVCVNGIICTMLMTHTPETLKMIMVDPKRVELTNYNGIPHLMAPVVTELERIVGVLKWVQREMDERYRSFAMAGARNIQDYNERIDRGQIKDGKRLPFLIVIVDELADLMMLAPDETERVITRLAQMARATGIHIILSTQRPSVDVVTGLIKANFPARIAFAVATGVDSRVILDGPGAEKLLGRGDMLFQSPDSPMPLRMQGVYLSDKEIQKIVDYWRDQASKAGYTGGQALLTFAGPGLGASTGPRQSAESFNPRLASPKPLFEDDTVDVDGDGVDDLFDEAVELVRDMEKASISLLQRHLRIGYTRAARLIDLMEDRGVIGPHEGGSKPRTVLGPDGKPLSVISDDDEDDDLP